MFFGSFYGPTSFLRPSDQDTPKCTHLPLLLTPNVLKTENSVALPNSVWSPWAINSRRTLTAVLQKLKIIIDQENANCRQYS